MRGVGVVETLGEAVDEDTGVGRSDNDLGVGAVAVVNGQEAGTERALVLVDGNLLGGGAGASAAVVNVGLHGADANNTEEAALGLEQTEDDNSKRNADGGVDTVLNGAEDGDENTSEEDDHLNRSNAPELVDDLGGSDDISDSVDDDGREGSVGDVEEDSSQGIEGKEHNDGGDDTSEGSADTSLGLDSSSREGASGRVSTEEGSEQVGDTNSDKLLRGVDDVVVDTAEGLGDGDVLNQDNDDGSRKLRKEGLDDAGVDLGGSSVGEATGHILDDADHRVILAVDVDSSTDTSIQENDKSSPKSGNEKEGLGTVRLALGQGRAGEANDVEHEQGGETESGVDLGAAEVLEGLDDDLVGGSTGVDTRDAHELGHLTSNNADTGASHEGTDGG